MLSKQIIKRFVFGEGKKIQSKSDGPICFAPTSLPLRDHRPRPVTLAGSTARRSTMLLARLLGDEIGWEIAKGLIAMLLQKIGVCKIVRRFVGGIINLTQVVLVVILAILLLVVFTFGRNNAVVRVLLPCASELSVCEQTVIHCLSSLYDIALVGAGPP